jgi:hypothetical protein
MFQRGAISFRFHDWLFINITRDFDNFGYTVQLPGTINVSLKVDELCDINIYFFYSKNFTDLSKVKNYNLLVF